MLSHVQMLCRYLSWIRFALPWSDYCRENCNTKLHWWWVTNSLLCPSAQHELGPHLHPLPLQREAQESRHLRAAGARICSGTAGPLGGRPHRRPCKQTTSTHHYTTSHRHTPQNRITPDCHPPPLHCNEWTQTSFSWGSPRIQTTQTRPSCIGAGERVKQVEPRSPLPQMWRSNLRAAPVRQASPLKGLMQCQALWLQGQLLFSALSHWQRQISPSLPLSLSLSLSLTVVLVFR